jgi:signal transduction histidine kinase
VKEPRPSRGIRVWPSLAIGAVGLCAAFLGWRITLDQQHFNLHRTAVAVAAESRAAVQAQLASERDALLGTASAWRQFGRDPLAQWRFETAVLIAILPGVERVLWVDHESGNYRIARRSGTDTQWDEGEAVDGLLDEAARYAGGMTLSGPHMGSDGEMRMHLLASVGSEGVMAASIGVRDLLASVLADSAPGYAVSVYWGDVEIYRQGEPAKGLAWWSAEGEVKVGTDVTWRVVHRPTALLAASEASAAPLAVGLCGSVFALLLAVLFHQVRRSQELVRFLDATNVRLDERVREAAEKDRELRRLNRNLESRIAERTSALDEAVQELEAFNYSVSHDLRSPIGAIVNFTAVLEEDYRQVLGGAGAALLERIQASASSALSLLEGLLQLSRVAREEMDRRPVDMKAAAESAFQEALAAEPDRPEVDFEVGDLPEALADTRLVRRVFGNLLANAIKYTRPREKRRVRVTGRREGDELVYCVEDNGIGFDMRFTDKLFGVFERLHSSESYEGSGVGLAIVARIVRRHGGRVWAEGEIDGGARFYFTLPAEGE